MKVALIVLTSLLTTGCMKVGGSETEATICRELRRDLPTYSRADTEQTKREGADFLDTFGAVCGH